MAARVGLMAEAAASAPMRERAWEVSVQSHDDAEALEPWDIATAESPTADAAGGLDDVASIAAARPNAHGVGVCLPMGRVGAAREMEAEDVRTDSPVVREAVSVVVAVAVVVLPVGENVERAASHTTDALGVSRARLLPVAVLWGPASPCRLWTLVRSRHMRSYLVRSCGTTASLHRTSSCVACTSSIRSWYVD